MLSLFPCAKLYSLVGIQAEKQSTFRLNFILKVWYSCYKLFIMQVETRNGYYSRRCYKVGRRF